METTIDTNNKRIHSWLKEDEIEAWALEQAKNIANAPYLATHVAIMPDSHQWYWVPIGCVFGTSWAIVPNAVWVDIWCGMLFCRTKVKTDTLTKEQYEAIRIQVLATVPVWFHHNKNSVDIPTELIHLYNSLKERLEIVSQNELLITNTIWTLGWGNHFIEIQEDQEWYLCIMIHSWSRQLWKIVADHYIKLANANAKANYHDWLESNNLGYLHALSEWWLNYIAEHNYLLQFATRNRKLIMDKVLDAIYHQLGEFEHFSLDDWRPYMIDCCHNFVSLEHHFWKNVYIHRKWAVRTSANGMYVIPGSMWSKSFVLKWQWALSNMALASCSHWAGRKLSRTKAQQELNLEETIKELDELWIVHGVSDKVNLDEAPGAYKNIDEVIAKESDIIGSIELVLKPLVSIKW